jgi:hypothetical protein
MRELRAALRALLVDHRLPDGVDPPREHTSDAGALRQRTTKRTSSAAPRRRCRSARVRSRRSGRSGDRPAADEDPDPVAEFLAAHAVVTNREKKTLAALLASGNVEESVAHAARLLSRLDATGGKDATAHDALALLDDPKALGPMAARLLDEDIVPGPYLDRVLRRAANAIAHALWSARREMGATHERRARFVSWLSTIGDGARPMLVMGLARLVPAQGQQEDPDLAEDLLLAIPAGGDAALAHAVAPFTESPAPRVSDLAHSARDRIHARASGA